MKKLAIITTHPVQYNAPLFALLSARKVVDIKVFYTWGNEAAESKYDPGFGKTVKWDVPLLDGYAYCFVENISRKKGSHHFMGINNPHLISDIKLYRPDSILVYGWAFMSHLQVMRKFKNKIPVYFRGDSTLLDSMGFFDLLKRKLILTWIYRFVDLAFYVGKANKQYFEFAGLNQNQLIFAPHTIDNSRFECADTKCIELAKEFRSILKIPSKSKVLLFSGKLEKKKSPELLIEAFLNVVATADTVLVLVGDGELGVKLRQLYKEKAQVIFAGFQNQSCMPALYMMADVFILPSGGPGETWGLAVNEAMACGKPVIVSDKCGCAQDLVYEGKNGFIFKAGCQKDLENKMLQILQLQDSWSEMGKFSKEIIDGYSYQITAAKIENVLTCT